MLEHAPELPHSCERRGEAPSVLAFLVAPARLHESGQATPPRARRVGHDRMRPGVLACVLARQRPGLDVG